MTTLNLQVAESAADGREATNGTVVYNTTSFQLHYEYSSIWNKYIFQNVTIPKGSTINSATLSVNVSSASYDSPNCNIFGELASSASLLSGTSYEISSKSQTSATVAWSATDIGTGWKSPGDIAAIIQEIIDQAGWASGNRMGIILQALSGCALAILAYDYSGNVSGPKLDIVYTAGGGLPIKSTYYARMRG